jgi:hypothetical protein
MRTVDRTGTVVEVLKDHATVEISREDCCTDRLSCSCCSAAARPERLRVEPDGLTVGDTVVVSTPAYLGYVSVLVVFVLPLVLAVLGGWVGAVIEGDSVAHDMPIIIGGVVGIASWLPVALLINRRLSQPGNRHVRKLSGAEP